MLVNLESLNLSVMNNNIGEQNKPYRRRFFQRNALAWRINDCWKPTWTNWKHSPFSILLFKRLI